MSTHTHWRIQKNAEVHRVLMRACIVAKFSPTEPGAAHAIASLQNAGRRLLGALSTSVDLNGALNEWSRACHRADCYFHTVAGRAILERAFDAATDAGVRILSTAIRDPEKCRFTS